MNAFIEVFNEPTNAHFRGQYFKSIHKFKIYYRSRNKL